MAQHRDPEDSVDDLPRAPINRTTLREAARLFRYLLPYRVKFTLAMLALFTGSLMGLAFPWLAGDLVEAALLNWRGETSTVWNQNINLVALALGGVLFVQAILAFFRSLWFVEVGERSLADLRRDTFARLVRLPLAFHNKRRVGELASRIATDITLIHDTLIETIPHFIRQLVLLVGGVTLIAVTSLRLTGLMLASLPVLMIVAVVFGRLLRRVWKEASDRIAETSVIVEESLQNIASVKGFTNETYEERRYRAGLDSFLVLAIRAAWYEGAFHAFIVFALFGSIVLILWYGAWLVQAGFLEPGGLTRFMFYTLYVAGAFGSFAELYGHIQRSLGATQRVRELLVEPTETPDPALAEPPPLPRLRGEVVFEKAAFRYPSRPEVAVLQDVSLEACPGQRIALVGPSGAGKSTIVSLLMRFYELESGQIRIDGQDARSYDLLALRQQMAIVPQEVILFGGTIAENIAYGNPGASPEEIEAAARMANAHEFITAFPEGYQTRVGERGVQLSGGQRQRVAIARALLRDPAILILDEATSSLDSESESLVLQALDRLMQGRTSLIIAHRLSTVRRADRIYVIKEGRTVEAGTHAELVAQPDGLYRMLSELQFDPAARLTPAADDEGWPMTSSVPGS
jgi:ATP-binding cassette subfamily B protein